MLNCATASNSLENRVIRRRRRHERSRRGIRADERRARGTVNRGRGPGQASLFGGRLFHVTQRRRAIQARRRPRHGMEKKKRRVGQDRPRSPSETRSSSGRVDSPVDRQHRLHRRPQPRVRAGRRRARRTANHGHRPGRATQPINTRLHIGPRRDAMQTHRRAQQSRPSSEAGNPAAQSGVVARKSTMRVSTARPRATAAASRTTDGAVPLNAHTSARTATWRAGGRRPITVVVRDERPV